MSAERQKEETKLTQLTTTDHKQPNGHNLKQIILARTCQTLFLSVSMVIHMYFTKHSRRCYGDSPIPALTLTKQHALLSSPGDVTMAVPPPSG